MDQKTSVSEAPAKPLKKTPLLKAYEIDFEDWANKFIDALDASTAHDILQHLLIEAEGSKYFKFLQRLEERRPALHQSWIALQKKLFQSHSAS